MKTHKRLKIEYRFSYSQPCLIKHSIFQIQSLYVFFIFSLGTLSKILSKTIREN